MRAGGLLIKKLGVIKVINKRGNSFGDLRLLVKGAGLVSNC